MEHIPTQNPIMDEENLNIKKEISYYLFFWPWFVGAILFTLTAAFLYLRYTDKVYESTAQIQIKTDTDAASFLTGDLDIFGMDQVTVENDMAVITSQYILSQVVQRLDLQTSVYAQGSIKSSLQFNGKLPFELKFDEQYNSQEWEMKIANNQATISSDSINYKINKGEILNEAYFTINPKDSLFLKNQSYLISYSSLNKTVAT